jgi:cytochrome c biogenesis protein CcmG/thiol:disulfide interchange protein DsbE
MSGWKAWLAFAVAAAFLGLLGFGLTRSPAELPSALIGKPAPEISGVTLEGDSLRLSELKGRVVVVNFWASWCGPCRVEHPVLEQLARTYPDDEAVLVGVVHRDSRQNAVGFMERLGGDWPSVMDPGSRTALEYGITGVPETFFVSREGEVARKHVGPVDWNVVASTVDSLLALPRSDPGAP